MSLAALKTELDAGHPDTGAYDPDHATAAAEINAVNRPAPANPLKLLDYCLLNEHRNSNLYGRIAAVAKANVADLLPLGDAGANIVMTLDHISAAQAFIRLMEPDVVSETPLSNAAFGTMLNALAGGASNAQCMGPSHKTALQGLSKNQQSRASELGLGRVTPGKVEEARSKI